MEHMFGYGHGPYSVAFLPHRIARPPRWPRYPKIAGRRVFRAAKAKASTKTSMNVSLLRGVRLITRNFISWMGFVICSIGFDHKYCGDNSQPNPQLEAWRALNANCDTC